MSLLSPKQVAEELNVPLNSARDLMRTKMVHMYVGKHLRVSPQAFAAWKSKQEEQPCEESRFTVEGESGGAASVTGAAKSSAGRPAASRAKPRSSSSATSSGQPSIRITQPRRRRPSPPRSRSTPPTSSAGA